MAKNKKNGQKNEGKTESRQPSKPRASSKGRSVKTTAVLILVFLVLIAGIAFYLLRLQRNQDLSPGKYKGYNVLLITLDTTRADHLPAYGYNMVKTPNLDQLAGKSFLFEDAISHVPLTVPSHTSIMTGRIPPGHGIRDNSGYFLDQKEITLAEVLKGNGYATGAFVSAFVLDSRWQLNQGFDLYYDFFNLVGYRGMNPRDVQRRGEETEIEVEHWLKANGNKRFFCWAHFYDPHDPYDPPEPYKSEYSDRPYDGEIAYTDEVVGRLLKKLEDLGLQDRTIVVLTGDHGEGLGDHQEISHAMFVYNSTLHVPLFIHVPGGTQQRIKGVVRHIDLAPTILEFVGIQPPAVMQGASLIPMMNGMEKIRRIGYSESLYADLHYGWSPLQSITTEQYKFIQAPRAELYDRVNDPGEMTNLINEKPSIAKVLKSELTENLEKYSSKDLKGPQKMDAEAEEKLRALGYIGGTAVSTEESRKIDPKDKLEIASGMQQASAAAGDKKFAEALELIGPVLQEDPGMVEAHFIAGASYSGLGQYGKAIDELLKTVGLRADHTMALYNLGYCYEMTNDLKSAEFWYQQVLKYESKHLLATVKLAGVYRLLKQPEKARSYFLTAVNSYERSLENTEGTEARSDLLTTLGEMYFGAGEPLKAEKCIREAVALTPDRPMLHYNLAQVQESKGDLVGAIDEYRKEIEIQPKNFKAYNDLGILYKQLNRLNEAVICFEKVVELHPEDPRGYLLLASTYKKMGRNQEANELLRLAQQKQATSHTSLTYR